jgi:starch phosphorylase
MNSASARELQQYGLSATPLIGEDKVLCDRHLVFDRAIDPSVAFQPLREMLVRSADYYMHLADLTSYCQAHERLGALYSDPDAWAYKAIRNVASSGKFSSDRTIAECASETWKVEPCPVR